MIAPLNMIDSARMCTHMLLISHHHVCQVEWQLNLCAWAAGAAVCVAVSVAEVTAVHGAAPAACQGRHRHCARRRCRQHILRDRGWHLHRAQPPGTGLSLYGSHGLSMHAVSHATCLKQQDAILYAQSSSAIDCPCSHDPTLGAAIFVSQIHSRDKVAYSACCFVLHIRDARACMLQENGTDRLRRRLGAWARQCILGSWRCCAANRARRR